MRSSPRVPAAAVACVLLIAAGLQASSAAAQERIWPGESWPRATFEARGMDGTPLLSLDEAAAAGRYGNTDRLFVVQGGHVVLDVEYGLDYERISHGRTGPLGCGAAACSGPGDVHAYNYLHPSVHPWWQGRDVHSLQSITKSVAATVLGAGADTGTAQAEVSILRSTSRSEASSKVSTPSRQEVWSLASSRCFLTICPDFLEDCTRSPGFMVMIESMALRARRMLPSSR